MKNVFRVFLAACVLLNLLLKNVQAQQAIALAFNKTSHIVFDADIVGVDRGSRDVLAQKAQGVKNILQLKAGRKYFTETNLTVITADGKLHEFNVSYADRPAKLIWTISDTTTSRQEISFEQDITSSEMLDIAKVIVNSYHPHNLKAKRRNEMELGLERIYIHNNTMFFHIQITNHSNIPFDVDVLRCFVSDKQKLKRTASQEITKEPLFIYGDAQRIGGKAVNEIVLAVEKFTIPDAKNLVVELLERNGGRHLSLRLNDRKLRKVVSLN